MLIPIKQSSFNDYDKAVLRDEITIMILWAIAKALNNGDENDKERYEYSKERMKNEMQAEKQKEIDRKFGIKPIHLKEFV